MTKNRSKRDKKMSTEKRRSIVWATIERIAFKPKPADTNTWLSLYERTLPKPLGLQPGDVMTQRHMSFKVVPLNIFCKYHLEQIGAKYDAEIRLVRDEARLLWTIHVDPIKASKAGLQNESGSYPKQDLKHLKNDVENVLEGMVFHPRNHTHLEDCGLTGCAGGIVALKTHEIRIGSGIENLFVFLFHLRYQFCLVSEETRKQERIRLINLFRSAIEETSHYVSPKMLFNF